MNHRTRWVGAAAACAALVVPATAAAATKTVYAGPPPGAKQLAAKLHATSLAKYQPDINAFFNQHTTIHVGDKVKFVLQGFHTVDIPAAGGSDLPLILPSGGLVSGVNDAAGNPFWFNGKLPNLSFNPMLFKPLGSTTFTGKARFDSGLPLGAGAPKPFSITFTKPGTYKYFCDVHAGMVGYVTVKPKTATVSTAKQDAAAQVKQLTGDIKGALKAVKTKVPANTVSLGQSAPGGVELFSMFPSTLTVPTGTVVTFEISKQSRETHTATFGPQGELMTLSKSFGPSIPAQGVFPSDPTQPVLESPTNHGDGFANIGVVDRDPSTTTIPSSGQIQFTAPGTYQFICLIHPFMHGTIIVK